MGQRELTASSARSRENFKRRHQKKQCWSLGAIHEKVSDTVRKKDELEAGFKAWSGAKGH